MTPKQILLAHCKEMHGTASMRLPKQVTLVDLQRRHARAHWRYDSASHYHEFDNAGPQVGPNTEERRPSGWYTGEGVVLKAQVARRGVGS